MIPNYFGAIQAQKLVVFFLEIVPPPLFCPKNVDFIILRQFLAILPKMTPYKWTPDGKPRSVESLMQCSDIICEFVLCIFND